MSVLGNAWLLLLLFYLILAKAQASRRNPFIWQILAEYDIAISNKTKHYLEDTSSKIYSQDFQTVFEYKDYFGYNERLVIDFGDGCAQTIQDIEAMNGHWATSPSMMSQPSVALVRRKGSCVRWSDKIAHVQYLSAEYNLQITSIVIYDNILYNDTQFISESTDDADYPTFTDPLPPYRDIQFMTEENTLDLGSTFVAVYFVPLSYIQYLNQTLIQRTFEPNGTRQVYTQLTFSLSEHYFPPSNTTQTNEDDAWNREREKRNYIIYAITAGVVLILVFFVIRWCLAFRIQEDQVERGESLLLRDIRDHVIAFDDLERLCPVLRYGDTSMTNTVCAICLDEFLADFFVRVLPCHHGYCTACIDVWLTKKSCMCPICKYDCRKALEPSCSSTVMDQ